MELQCTPYVEKILAIAARHRRESEEFRRQQQAAALRRAAATYEPARPVPTYVREWRPEPGDPLARLELKVDTLAVALEQLGTELRGDIQSLKARVAHIEETMATKVELEALRGDYNAIADGFAAVSVDLQQVHKRLDGTDERLGNIEMRVLALERRRRH